MCDGGVYGGIHSGVLAVVRQDLHATLERSCSAEAGAPARVIDNRKLKIDNRTMPTLFERIIARDIPAKIVFEDDSYIAVDDIDPQAPLHLLVIPKRVIHSIGKMTPADAELVGGLFVLAARLVSDAGYTDFRTVFNSGAGAQQTVFHLHLHVLAGRPFTWPPG